MFNVLVSREIYNSCYTFRIVTKETLQNFSFRGKISIFATIKDNMAGIHFDITGDNSHFLKSINGVQQSIKQTVDFVEKMGGELDAAWKKVAEKGTSSFNIEGIEAHLEIVQKVFDKAVDSFGLTSEQAKKVKREFTDTILDIATSGKSVEEQQQMLGTAVRTMLEDVSNSAHGIETAAAALDTFNSASSAATTATTANAISHGTAATTVGVEAGAHGVNATSIGKETEAVIENTEAQKLSNKERDAASEKLNEQLQFYERLAENIQKGVVSEEQYQKILQDINSELGERSKTISELNERIDKEAALPTRYDLKSGEIINQKELDAAALQVEGLKKELDYESDEYAKLIKSLNEIKAAHEEKKKAEEDSITGTISAVDERLKKYEEEKKKVIEIEDAIKQGQTELENLTHRSLNLNGQSLFDFHIPKFALDDEGREKYTEITESIKNQKEELAELNKSIEEYENSLQETSSAGEGFAGFRNHISDLKSEYENLTSALKNYEAEYNALSEKKDLTSGQIKRLEELKGVITQTKKEISATSEAIRDVRGETWIGKVQNYFTSANGEASAFKKNIDDIIQKIPYLEKIKENISKMFDGISNKVSQNSFVQGLSNGFSRFSAETKVATDAITSFGGKLGNVLTGNGRFQESLHGVTSAFGGMLGPISAATNGIKAMTISMMKMALTPLGAVLAVLILAFKSMYDWLNKDAEGQMQLAKISGYLGSVMASLGDIFVKVGKYLFHAFADAGAPMNAFAKSFVTTFKTAVTSVVGLVSGLGNAIKGIFTADWDTFKKGVTQVWDAAKNGAKAAIGAIETSWKGVIGTFKVVTDGFNTLDGTDLLKSLKNINDKAKEAADIAVQTKQNQIEIVQSKVKEAELDAQIAESREKIYTLTGKAKVEELARLKALQKGKYAPRIAQMEKALELSQKEESLHTTSIERRNETLQLETQVKQLKAQQAAATRFTTRMEESAKRTLAQSAKNAENKGEKVDAAEGRLSEIIQKQEIDRIKKEEDTERRIAEARIAAMHEGYAKTKAERELQFKSEIDALQRQRENAVEEERRRQKEVFNAEQAVVAAKGGKAKRWDNTMFNAQDEEVKKINEYYDTLGELILKKQHNIALKQQRDEMRSMIEYNKQFGNFEEKKLAIVQQYEEQIEEAIQGGDSYKAAELIQKRDAELKSLNNEKLLEGINWEAVFQNILDYDVQFLEELEGQLQEAIKSGIESGMKAADLKVLNDKLNEARETIASKKGGIFGSTGILGGSWMGNINSLQNKQNILEQRAQDARNNAAKYGAAAEEANRKAQGAKSNLDYMIEHFGKNSDEAKKAEAEKIAADEEATKAAKDKKKADADATAAAGAAASGMKSLKLGMTDAIIHGVNDNVQSASKMITEWGIGSEDFQQKFAKFAESSQYATAAFDSLKSGDVAGTIYNVGEAFNSLGESFGLWSNSNVEESEREIEQRENANKELIKALESLTEAFKNSDLSSGIKTYEKAKSVLQAQIDNSAQAVGVKFGEYNGHHSTNYYGHYATAMLNEIASRARQAGVITNNKKAQDLNAVANTFTPEELDAIRSFDPTKWTEFIQEIRNADKADLGAADTFVAFVDNYASSMKDLERQWKETITGLSWDSLKSSFQNALGDMTKSVDEWSDDVDNIFRENVSNFISSKYTSTDTTGGKQMGVLAKWYDDMAKYTESNGIDKDEAAELRRRYLEIQEQAAKERDDYYRLLGIEELKSDSEARGSINAAKSMSEDTANELVGRATATQIAVETFKVQKLSADNALTAQVALCLTQMGVMTTLVTEGNTILNDIRTNQAIGNMYLKDISDASKGMYEEWGSEIRAMRQKIDTL